MHKVLVRELAPAELDDALSIVVRAMRDNPLHVQALGHDPLRRAKRVRRLQSALIESVTSRGYLLCAEYRGSLAGVLGVAERKVTFTESTSLLSKVFAGLPPLVMMRTGRWLAQWVRRLPRDPYCHLGPVAVDVDLQGIGIGSALMDVFCARMDAQSSLAYLETDKAANVGFYRKFGFTTVCEANIIGVGNWFMLRKPYPRQKKR